MDRHANGFSLVGDESRNLLANPPSCVSGELEASAPVETLDALHEPDIPLLKKVVQRHSAVQVFLGDGVDQFQVRDSHAITSSPVRLHSAFELARRLWFCDQA